MPMIIRSAPVFVGSLKIGELKEVTCTFKSNGELVVLSDEVLKSKGVTTSEVSFETVVPTTGLALDLFQIMIVQADINVTIPFNGKTYDITGTFDEATLKSVVQSGMTTGSFKFTGGTPVQTQSSF